MNPGVVMDGRVVHDSLIASGQMGPRFMGPMACLGGINSTLTAAQKKQERTHLDEGAVNPNPNSLVLDVFFCLFFLPPFPS